jgi:MarR family transcriptional regulator, organic hydroperoxide resistance regulator
MHEPSSKLEEIQAVLEALESVWGGAKNDVPAWAAADLTFGQVRLLFLLSKHGPSPVSRIAEWLGVGLPATSGILDRIERHGLVTREHRHDDRRVVECALTDQGHQLIEQISGMRREMFAQTIGVLDDAELAELLRLVRTILERLQTGTK